MLITNYKAFHSSVQPSDLPPVGFDTHAHISSFYYKDDLSAMLQRTKLSSIRSVLSVCLTLDAYYESSLLYDNNELMLYTAVGIHPCDNSSITLYKEELSSILKKDSRCLAVGETGLDYHWDTVSHNIQRELFIEHISLAKEYDKTLVLHTRKAEDDVYSILCKEGMEHKPVIWHCYGGSVECAERIVNNGWYISFAGNITYPNAINIREVLHAVPLEQLLIETDSPYLSPQTKRGLQNEPSYLMYVAEVIAHKLQCSVQDIWNTTSLNAKRVLRI